MKTKIVIYINDEKNRKLKKKNVLSVIIYRKKLSSFYTHTNEKMKNRAQANFTQPRGAASPPFTFKFYN